jgi:hypothetical protein
MNRFLLPLALVFCIFRLSADSLHEKAFPYLDPRIMAQGGSSAGVTGGYSSLFTNPAGFTYGNSLTIPSVTVWMHTRPDRVVDGIKYFSGSAGRSDEALGRLQKQIADSGFGVGGQAGIGLINSGFGLGVSLAFDSSINGDDFPLGLSGFMLSELSFVAGDRKSVV